MQAAQVYVTDAVTRIDQALRRMHEGHLLPLTHQDIRTYVHYLLSPKEEKACNMATD